jgi:predicted house-cleaning noncanonical NTP pyrophosphatase (MazG superfamily)
MGRRRKLGYGTPQKNNSKDLVENGYPVPDPNKIMIKVTNDLSDNTKKSLKEEITDKLTEKLMEKLQDTARNYKMHSRNFKSPQIKNLRRHKNKQIKSEGLQQMSR